VVDRAEQIILTGRVVVAEVEAVRRLVIPRAVRVRREVTAVITSTRVAPATPVVEVVVKPRTV
jgi:hypothetical protein